MSKVTSKKLELILEKQALIKAEGKALDALIEEVTQSLLSENNVTLALGNEGAIDRVEHETCGLRAKLKAFPKYETFTVHKDIAPHLGVSPAELKRIIDEVKDSKPIEEMRAKLTVERF